MTQVRRVVPPQPRVVERRVLRRVKLRAALLVCFVATVLVAPAFSDFFVGGDQVLTHQVVAQIEHVTSAVLAARVRDALSVNDIVDLRRTTCQLL